MIWTKEKTDYLIENYPHFGSRHCANQLSLTIRQVSFKARHLGLKLTKEGWTFSGRNKEHKPKPNERLNVNPTQFMEPSSAEVAYLLGFLWGDGWITDGNYGVWSEIVSDDAADIFPIFLLTGRWNVSHRHRKGCRAESKIQTHGKTLYNFLKSLDYGDKAGPAPSKILDIIPPVLHAYWFRGLSDADGCFYRNPKHYTNQYCISGPYEQDWSFVERLFTEIEVASYRILRVVSKKGHKSSKIRVTNKRDIVKIGQYLYADREEIGLQRKRSLFNEIAA